MRTIFRLRIAGAIVPFAAALAVSPWLFGCENGRASQGGATAGPSPAWVEQFHREQLRHEYERQKYEEQMQGR